MGSGQLNWNIGEIGGTPNIVSELNYHIKRLWVSRVHTRISITQARLRGLFVDLSGQWGIIRQGQSIDRDWTQNDRQGLFSLSQSDTTGDNIHQARIAMGITFAPVFWFHLSPIAGYSVREQFIRVQNGMQIIAQSPQNKGAFPAPLNSTYHSKWLGPDMGVELDFMPHGIRGQHFLFNARYHWTEYNATADWNLRPDFQHPVSFRHILNKSHGISLSSSWIYPFTKHLSINTAVYYQYFTGRNGRDELFYANGTQASSSLNNVTWEFTQIMMGISYQL